MVSVLPSASPRAAALGRKSYFAMAASTACFRPSLTFTVPLMIRETVLADTPASRATILKVTDLRGAGPLLPRVRTGPDFTLIDSSLPPASGSAPVLPASCLSSQEQTQR